MKFYGELLIFILLFISNIRVFFPNEVRRDSLVALAPFTFFISILMTFSWGIDTFILLALISSFLVFISNFHAMFRYAARLYVDHYSPLMYFWAVLTSIINLASIVVLIIFAPIDYNNKRIGVEENRYRFQGTFYSGFVPAANFTSASCNLYKFEKADKPESEETDELPAVVLISDKRGDTVNYKPYLQFLAKEGFTVYSADFYTKDAKWNHSITDFFILRRCSNIIRSLKDSEKYMTQKEFYTYNSSLECKAVTKLLKDELNDSRKIFFISDVMANVAIEDFTNANPDLVAGYFYLDSIPEYSTPGYGVIEQTNPLLAKFLGYSKDSKGFYTKYLVLKSKKAILNIED